MRCTERNAPEWLAWAVDMTGMQGVEEIRGRVAQKLCASACPLGKTVLTSGTEAAVTQGAGEKQGDVAQRAPCDQYPTAEV